MSGGHFDYNQYHITQIADSVEHLVRKNGIKDIDDYGDDRDYNFRPHVIARFKEGVNVLRTAFIFAQRIDYLLSGDDGQEMFLSRLVEDLNDLEKEGNAYDGNV